jgi:glycosyltransferase involved in cell wall biosynthesis
VTDRLHVIRCGVDGTRFRPADDIASKTAPARARVLCVAALEEKKGHRHLLSAVALLKQRGIDIELVVVGDGDLRDQLHEQAETLGIDGIRWRGRLSGDEVLAELRAATCFVLPSVKDHRGRMEGIPVALIEAMAVGIPVVASDLSGVAELVQPGKTGWLVPPGDPGALADAIADVLDGREVQPRVAAARTVVAQQYDLHTNAKHLVGLFAAIATAPATAGERRIPQ